MKRSQLPDALLHPDPKATREVVEATKQWWQSMAPAERETLLADERAAMLEALEKFQNERGE